MNSWVLDILICPACLPGEYRLKAQVQEKSGNDIGSGALLCPECRTSYPIKDGVAVLLPETSKGPDPCNKYEAQGLLSSYLWSHYADLWEDEDATTAYKDWARRIHKGPGYFLDAGCAVGRFAFEMSQKSDFVVGLDRSHAFIRAARELKKGEAFTFSIPSEGLILEYRTIRLQNEWLGDRVEFIVGDALALPFPSRFFSALASLNLVDKVPKPLGHLQEMNRVAKERGAQFLFSDPFSWSLQFAEEKHWLGGTSKGPFSGKGVENVVALLKGKRREFQPPWKIEDQDELWWKIRNHRNHFELIRSCFIKAVR